MNRSRLILTVLFMFAFIFLFSCAAHGYEIAFKIGEDSIIVNGKKQTMDVQPYISNGRTYLPLRYVALALGVSPEDILWDDAKQLVKINWHGRTLEMDTQRPSMVINGALVLIDAPAQVINGRIMLPVRWVAVAFGLNINWNESAETINIEVPSVFNNDIQPNTQNPSRVSNDQPLVNAPNSNSNAAPKDWQEKLKEGYYGNEGRTTWLDTLNQLLDIINKNREQNPPYVPFSPGTPTLPAAPLPLSVPVQKFEPVYLIKDLSNFHALIMRQNGEIYLIQYGVGVVSLPLYTGKIVYIYSPGFFAGIGSKIIIPEINQSAIIWNSQRIR